MHGTFFHDFPGFPSFPELMGILNVCGLSELTLFESSLAILTGLFFTSLFVKRLFFTVKLRL